jgi:glycosyltransferase involved in cell wall biosynthesis
MKAAFVVQRYGLEINGGAELHCRWIAEHMCKYWEVEVLTTQALDYITWRNHYPRRQERLNGVLVRRFPVTRTRDPERFGKLQNLVLDQEHTFEDELKWLEAEGPCSPALIAYIQQNQGSYDYLFFFSYRYYHSYWGIVSVPQKSILVPTAEHDDIIHLYLFKELFRKPRGFVYNSEEERQMIQTLTSNRDIPGEVVGVGTEIPGSYRADDFRQKYGIQGDYLLYIGRIDKNKGCDELFKFFLRFKRDTGSPAKLILIGSSIIKIPLHPDIVYLGFLSEEEKFAALSGAQLLFMPSFYESLSMVTLEAWALGRPVLANARCAVLKGQCLRSQAGLYYADYPQFSRALQLLLADAELRQKMGEHGRRYFQERYTWDKIERKYMDLVRGLNKES